MNWIILVMFLNGNVIAIPLDGTGSKKDCQEFAIQTLKPHFEAIKGIACVQRKGNL